MKGDDAQVGQQPEKERNECTRLHGVQGGEKRGWCVKSMCVCIWERKRDKRQTQREGSHASSSSVWMISLTLALCPSAPLDLYTGVKQGFSKTRWALGSSQKTPTLQKTLSVRFIFNCWLVTINPLPQKIMKLQPQSFFCIQTRHKKKKAPCKKKEESGKESPVLLQNPRKLSKLTFSI